ncbi:MAG: hypothetical protein JO040_04635 [Gemmatimonadetes bacterium]|nr:hypothetical protein [Gemmatimonadota bacterium]
MAKSESTKGKSAAGGETKPAARGSRAAEDGASARTATPKKAAATADTGAASGGATAKKGARKAPAAGASGAPVDATTGAVAKKGARKSSGGGGGGGARKPAGGGSGGGHDVRSHLRRFAASRPGGWNHDEWLGLLDELRGHGHDVSDPESVGRSLEQERLRHVLEGAGGVESGQVDALVERYGTLWSLRHAGVDEVAGLPGMSREAAERALSAMR